MRSIFVFFFLIAFLPIVGSAQDANGKGKMEVMMHMQSLRNSLLAKDSATLDKLLASDVTYGHSNGLLQTKAQLIHSVMSREQDYKVIDPSDMNIRIYDNAGIVTLKLHVTMTYEGKPLDMNMSATLTWVKMDKEWRLVARQSVKIN